MAQNQTQNKNSLKVYLTEHFELIINEKTKDLYSTVSALSRAVKKPQSVLRYWLKSKNIELDLKLVPTVKGLRYSKLCNEDLIAACLLKYNSTHLKLFVKLVEKVNGKTIEIPIFTDNVKHTNKKKTGKIYLLEGERHLKLGYTTNLQQRIKSHERWKGELDLVCLIEGSQERERMFHTLLHNRGESLGVEWYPKSRKEDILSLMHTYNAISIPVGETNYSSVLK